MTSRHVIELARYAMASIWTELEKDEPSEEGVRKIVNGFLNMTVDWQTKGKDLTDQG